MRLNNLFEAENFESKDFEEMELSDALYVLSEMADDGKLSEKEESIIEEMLDRLFNEEDDDIPMEETDELAEITEAEIVTHADTAGERTAMFQKSSMTDRIKNRIYQRRYRRRSDVKMKAKRKAAAQKRCKGKNRTAQLSRPGSTTYVCRLKNRFRSKLMKRVAKRYGRGR